MKKYNFVVCGGTFDHLHKGHKEFLRYALSISKKLLIGLTSDKYIKNSKLNPSTSSGQNSKLIEDYNTREENIVSFLKQERALDRIEVQPINDIYIPKIWEDFPIEAIVVTKDTILAAEKINLRRIGQRKYPLKIKIFPSVKSSDNGYISSSRIRNGEIDREGRLYINPLWLQNNLVITEILKMQLKKPFGMLFRKSDSLESLKLIFRHSGNQASPEQPESPAVHRDSGQARMTQTPYLITVGDVTTKTFNNLSLNQDISVIDFKVARKKQFFSIKELGFSGKDKIVKIANPAGCLTPALFKAASHVFKLRKKYGRIILQIDGEEDLSVLPLTLAAPLGSLIFYGQPGEGIVKVEVSEETKMRAYYLVSSFKRK